MVAGKFIAVAGNSVRFVRRRAFSQARKKIKECLEYGNSKSLYTTFVTLFQQLEPAQSIESIMRARAVPQELIEQWNKFFERITHAAYAKTNNEDADELCRMAKQWLERLEKII